MTGTRLILVLAAAIAATGGASLAAGPDPEPQEPGPRAEQQQPVQSVEPELAGSYGVLRRAANADDRLRDQAVGFVQQMLTKQNGAAPGLVRRAQVTASNTAVFVIPGRGHVCLYTTSPNTDEGSAGCNRTEEALKGYVTGIDWPRPGITRVVGLVTDAVKEVRLRDRSGGVERVTPVQNTYVFETSKDPSQIEWDGGGFPIPAGLGD